ncbi:MULTISPECIES: hypothetical protein [Herbaspirillum]|uniref:Uncharacterized protein n=2 Tax=Herbaspirillum huttiense TaxID=863372 RepID=A0AAJ2HAC1_9BURK|nr:MULTISPECIES: hypothetical protein [Herbaspirillum]MDR9836982.1 hypothetical protein [Herbaspirillum huttiense]
MEWLQNVLGVARATLTKVFPILGVVDAAQEFISESVAQRIRDEACTKAYAILAKTHRAVLTTIVWQNSVLLGSLLPVYWLRSPLPFYVAYVGVAGYSVYSVVSMWPLIRRLATTRSITATLSLEVLEAIKAELTQRQFIERKAVEWLGPDLKKISDEVAKKLKPDVLTAVANMGITLLLAFVAFRLFAIPLLEHKALL